MNRENLSAVVNHNACCNSARARGGIRGCVFECHDRFTCPCDRSGHLTLEPLQGREQRCVGVIVGVCRTT